MTNRQKNPIESVSLMGIVFFAACGLFGFLTHPVQAETLTLETYVPAPEGGYKGLRLVPRAPLVGACDIGTLYVEAPDTLRLCVDNGTGNGQWGSVGGGAWEQNGDNIYPIDTSSNPNIRVGIGTTTPDSRLTIEGDDSAVNPARTTLTLENLSPSDDTSEIHFSRIDTGTPWVMGIDYGLNPSPEDNFYITGGASGIGNNPRLFIATGGDKGQAMFGINNVTSPENTVHIRGDGTAYQNGILRLESTEPSLYLTDKITWRLKCCPGNTLLLENDDTGWRTILTLWPNGAFYANALNMAVDPSLLSLLQSNFNYVGFANPITWATFISADDTATTAMITFPEVDRNTGAFKNSWGILPMAYSWGGGTTQRFFISYATNNSYHSVHSVLLGINAANNYVQWGKGISYNPGETGALLPEGDDFTITNGNLFLYGNDGISQIFMEFPGTAADFLWKYENERLTLYSNRTGSFNTIIMDMDRQGNVGINKKAQAGFRLDVHGNALKTNGGNKWQTTSDRRLKKDITSIPFALKTLTALKGMRFEWNPKAPGGHKRPKGEHIGFIAQDVVSVIPQWVHQDKNGYKTLNLEGFDALAVEAIKELHKELKTVEEEYKQLKSRYLKLKAELKESNS